MVNYRHGTNYYEILEVDRDAPQTEIHKAYQRAKSTYSVDNPALYSMFSKDEARELVRMIEEAYSVLGNQALRRNYDTHLAGKSDLNETPSNSQPRPTTVTTNAPSQNAKPASAEPRKLQHDQLPDLTMPENNNPAEEGYSVRKKDTPKPTVPAGMGRTTVSTYKLDDAMEADIASRTEWDGLALQKIRQYRNVTIDQISDASRVSRSYLMAVETNDFNVLPAAVFVRGFVVQIARTLGLDENKVANAYMKFYKSKSGK